MNTSGFYKHSIRHLHITANSLLLGDEAAAFYVVHCSRNILGLKENPPRAIFEANVHGIPCVAKCWCPDLAQCSSNECMVYDKLTSIQSAHANVFAKLIGWGRIVCSSLFPAGDALLLEKRPGLVLETVWRDLTSVERAHVQSECMKAIGLLRSISIRLADAGKRNVLFDRDTGTVTLVDFEHIGFCEFPEDITSLEPEMSAIFGDEDGWVWWVRA
ncbi:hypothetical protein N7492_002351 [Penicillium capsulatum]|uniref:Protein kinase domain-containing protein n=1 Tax=Penicillium capsulatum TaxID=69766 RepID=A0A9W9LV49_9EURO|nr:hypothetical protein N7492_002351 [Penicillium capsulatum]